MEEGVYKHEIGATSKIPHERKESDASHEGDKRLRNGNTLGGLVVLEDAAESTSQGTKSRVELDSGAAPRPNTMWTYFLSSLAFLFLPQRISIARDW